MATARIAWSRRFAKCLGLVAFKTNLCGSTHGFSICVAVFCIFSFFFNRWLTEFRNGPNCQTVPNSSFSQHGSTRGFVRPLRKTIIAVLAMRDTSWRMASARREAATRPVRGSKSKLWMWIKSIIFPTHHTNLGTGTFLIVFNSIKANQSLEVGSIDTQLLAL